MPVSDMRLAVVRIIQYFMHALCPPRFATSTARFFQLFFLFSPTSPASIPRPLFGGPQSHCFSVSPILFALRASPRSAGPARVISTRGAGRACRQGAIRDGQRYRDGAGREAQKGCAARRHRLPTRQLEARLPHPKIHSYVVRPDGIPYQLLTLYPAWHILGIIIIVATALLTIYHDKAVHVSPTCLRKAMDLLLTVLRETPALLRKTARSARWVAHSDRHPVHPLLSTAVWP